MIHLHGDSQTREYEAAQALKTAIIAAWPHLENSSNKHVYLVVGAKCHGQMPRDVDVLLLADLGEGERIQPFEPFRINRDEPPRRLNHVTVRTLCCAIEVKDHPPEAVRFEGTSVKVRYKNNPDFHDASTQNENQVFSVKNYLEGQGLEAPFITPLLWLRNVPNTDLPPRPHGIIGANPTWKVVLNVIGSSVQSWWDGEKWVLSSFGQQASPVEEVARTFTWTLEPTKLDRQRIERMNQQAAQESDDLPVGEKLVMLRGRGGSGKTARLLHMAKALYDHEDARVLLLTYNKALVADTRRLLTLVGISDDIVSRAMSVQTAHEFFYDVLSDPGLALTSSSGPLHEEFLPRFEELKNEALELFKSGAATRGDMQTAQTWEFVFVDEAQDWPHNERDLLLHVVGPERIVVADGVDQFVRTQRGAGWKQAVHNDLKRQDLKTCLRMKANLVRFVNAFSNAMGLMSEHIVPHEEAVGGRVIVLDGSYFASDALHRRLMDINQSDGNAPVDMLFCVPPTLVGKSMGADGRKEIQSVPGQLLPTWGYKVWDGVSVEVRAGYATHTDQLRVVSYDSCRGLEGWVTVNLALDDFYEYKRALFERQLVEEGHADVVGQAHLQAARWTTIPLTRAMDTLVITLGGAGGRLRSALETAATQCGDFLEWQSIR